MTLEEFYKCLEPEKNALDMVDSNYLSKDDYAVCDYVISCLPCVSYSLFTGVEITKKYAINKSLKDFKNFNKENYNNLLNILNNTLIEDDYEMYNAAVETSFVIRQYSDNTKVITPGNILLFHFPKIIHDVDIVSIGHEYCHALKETNYDEHIDNLIFGEVIPIFYELVNYEKNHLKKKHLYYRLHWLMQQKNDYLLFHESFKNNGINIEIGSKTIYEFTLNHVGRYLNSFYYSLVLYSMYKKEPKKILELVSDVLKHNITTSQMLYKLNILHDIRGEMFESELNCIKKVLTI